MNRAEIISAVQAELDELSDLGSPDTDLIDSVLDKLAVEILRIAPIRYLTTTDLPISGTSTPDGYGLLDMPTDFVKLVSLDGASFERPILKVSEPTKEFFNAHLKPGVSKPVAIFWFDETGHRNSKKIMYSPAESGALTGEYVATEVAEGIDPLLQEGLVYKTAAHIAGILEEATAVQVLAGKFENWTKIFSE